MIVVKSSKEELEMNITNKNYFKKEDQSFLEDIKSFIDKQLSPDNQYPFCLEQLFVLLVEDLDSCKTKQERDEMKRNKKEAIRMAARLFEL